MQIVSTLAAPAAPAPLTEEQLERRAKARENIVPPALIMGGIGAAATTTLGKVRGGSWLGSLARGGAVGAVAGAATFGTGTMSYLHKSSPNEGAVVKSGVIAGTIALTGLGFAAVTRGTMNPGAARAAAGAAATDAAAGGGALAKYSVDLTQEAAAGRINRAFGMDDKVDELASILTATSKNNPLIVGPAGTGKTALIEELAHRINEGTVPDALKGTRLVSLNVDGMVGGTQYRGMFEQRLQSVLAEIQASDGKIIPFVDEFHKLVNAGAAQHTEGAGESIKPMLARGELRMIGATTDAKDEVGVVRGDAALSRRFTEVAITPPDAAKTVDIARSASRRYESADLTFTDAAIRRAVEVTEPIVERNQPDKALTLLDTAAARTRVARDAMPSATREKANELAKLRTEHAVVSRETTEPEVRRTSELATRIAKLESEVDAETAAFTAAKDARDELRSARQALEAARTQPQAEGAVPIDITAIEQRVATAEANAASASETFPSLFKRQVLSEDIDATPLPRNADRQADAARAAAPSGFGFRD